MPADLDRMRKSPRSFERPPGIIVAVQRLGMRTVSSSGRARWVFALAAAALTFFAAGQASAEDTKTSKTANTLLTDSGSYMPPKAAPQPTPVVGKPTPKAAPKAPPKAHVHANKKAGAKPDPHAHKKAKSKPNARVKAKAPKREKSSRKI